MSSVPAAKLLPGVAAGFVSAYALWAVLTKDASSKLPRSVLDPEWEKATEKLLAAAPRHASDVPMVMNPARFFKDDATSGNVLIPFQKHPPLCC